LLETFIGISSDQTRMHANEGSRTPKIVIDV